MTRNKFVSTFAAVCLLGQLLYAQSNYFPPAGSWERKSPEQVKMDSARLKEAIDFAVASEAKAPRSQELALTQTFGLAPFGELVGPTKDRGAPTGLVIRNGYIVAEWGEPSRVDMTHSVTKSFLSAVVGIAFDRHMIRSLQDRVIDYDAPIVPYQPGQRFDVGEKFGASSLLDLFATEHNKKITWDTMLRQTSDWEGTLWGKPDWADRPDRDPSKWLGRVRGEPGTVYEYNDVRVNALALATLNVWRRPLPEVLKENVMDEIGASNTWRWYGYENSYVIVDGKIIQSVSGGGHWGGGMFINAYDMARFGLMTERGGKWEKKQILSSEFVRQARTPTSVQPTYGFMNWFLNTDRKLYPNAPATAFVHTGNGVNIIYCDPDNDLVVVVRWIENNKINEFLGKLTASVMK
ncbi:MAG: serine hydrolase [Acidobacteria bacterium]|nr:serine hydrolase [Acidobacteriota bacterium]